MSDSIHSRGVKYYSSDLLQTIERDLLKNEMSMRKGTWEQGRLEAIRKEIRKRRREFP